jgi:hypothetical protein
MPSSVLHHLLPQMKISKRLKIIKRPRIIKRLKIIIRMLLFRSLISLKHTFSNRSVSGFVEPATSFSFIVVVYSMDLFYEILV